ncbi:cell wall anchor domain protein, partial [Peptoniphilus indolicus ATCC 29427]
ILLEIEEKSKMAILFLKIELRTDELSISQKLNNFRTINTNIWDSAVPIIIGNGQIEARGELEGNTITWTIKATDVSKNAKIEITLGNGQNVTEANTISGPELKSNLVNKSKYNFTLTPNNSSGEYKIVTKINSVSQEQTMTLSYNNSSIGEKQSRTISLKTQGGQEGNYRGFISARGSYLSVEDKDGKWEKALCINTNKTFPSFGTKYPFEETSIDNISSLITNKNYTNNEELIKKIKQAIYYADTNKESLLKDVNLTGGNKEQTFYHMIQGVIWRYTDGDDTYVAIKKHITNTQDQGKLIEAMNEIYEKSQNVQPQDYNRVEIRVFKPVNNETFQNLISYKIEKKIIPYSVGAQFKLLKLEEGTNNRLPGAKFSLKNSSGTFNKEQVGNYEGEITFSNIPQGEYTLKEEEAPIGYQKTDKIAKVRVDNDGQINIDGELIKKDSTSNNYGVDVFVVENPKNPDGPLGKFILKKTDKNGRPLKGAKFSLEGNGTSRTIELKDNEEGLTIDNLSPGIYTLKETEAPDGYTKTEETATITVDNAGNTSIKSDTNLSKDISVENDKKTLLSYDGKELNIVIAVENRYPKGTTERYSHYRTTAASIYDAFKNTPGLKGKVSIILAGTTPKNTNVVTFNIGGDFKFPDNNNAEGWMDQAFTKTAQIFGDSPNTENILITLFEGSYYGSNADRALRELSSTNINKVFNYTYSESWLGNVNNSLINRYNKLKITNLGFNSIISKSMFDENRDFYVKEYITGLDKNGNVTSADIGTHITKHQVTVATATISNEIFAKLIIKKTDKADNKELQGAEFTLTKKDGTKTLTAESTTNGIATFDNIPPGEYILKETKAPDKYKKIETEWNVYVSPTGSIFVNEKKDNVTPQEVKGEDISNKLNGTITLSTPKAPNGPLEIGKDSNGILIEGDFTATDVKAGDYFDLKISETIHYNMLQPDKPNQPTITDIAGEKIAVPTLLKSSLGGEKIIRYTFVKDLQSVKFSFKLDYSVDVYGAKNNGSYDFKASVGNTVGTINKQVSYSEGESSNDGLNMNASFDYTNDQNGKYSQVIYVNQKGSNITVPTHLEITPYVDSNYKNGYIKANISPIATAIKVYKVKSGQSLSNAVIYEKDKLEDVTDQFKDKIKIDYGKATVQFDNIGTDKYVVVVDSNMIYPQGQIQGTYLAQVASLVNNNPSSRVSMISGIATYDSSSLGTGSTYTSNKIELEIKNEKEDIKYGKFIIHKTDESGENLLVEATFKLSKKMSYGDSKTPLPETHQVKEDFQAQTKTTQKNGKVDFDNLPPGTYDLEETKSPDGYVKDVRKFVVVVQKNGNTFIVDADKYTPEKYPIEGDITKPNIDIDESKSRTTPMNLDGRIDITGYKMYKNISESGFDAHRRVFWMDFNLEFPEDTMPGDTFTIKLDKNLNMRGVSLEDRTQEPFIDEKGETVAEHIGTSYIDESYQFIYKVTDKFKQGEKLILSGTRPLYIDRNKIWTNDDISKTFINTIAGKKQDSFKFDNIYYGQYKSSTHYIEVGHVPFIYPKAQEVDIYVQASTYGIANPILTIEAGNLDFTNADIVISKKDGYGYIGESKERPASFGPGIMDFSNLVNSDKVDKTKGGIDITLPGDRNSNRYNVKITGAKILQKQQDISVTSSIQNYDYYGYLRPLSFVYGIGVDKGSSQAEIKKIPKIIIKKTDESGKNFLPGATFTLTQGGTSGNPNYSQTRTTNSKGELVFTGLKQGNNQYVLTEISPPKGYEKLKSESWKLYIDVDNQNVTVSNYYTNADDSVEIKDNFVTIKNKKGPYVSPEVLFRNYKNEITFYKVDAQGNSLNGAKFKLFKGDIEVENSEKSGSIIKYEKLSSGNYLVKETQTPEDFSAPADQTAASFTVKEDGTITNVMIYNGIKLVQSNEDIHKVINTKFSGKGKFRLKKNNENQQFILGSEFTLSKKENEKLPESFESVKKKIEDVNGIEFTGLLPGLYILKETKSPDGYKASDDYVVIVHQSGNTQVIDRKVFDILDREELKEDGDPDELFNTTSTIVGEGDKEKERDKNVFDGQLIKKLEVSDYELVSSNDNNQATVYPNKGEYLKVKFKINLPAQAKEGDYFYITYDENLNRLGNKMIEDEILPIKSYLGEELIKVTNKNGDNTYKYTLTSAVNNKQDFEIEIEAPLYVNRDKVKENALLTIKNTIPSKGKDNELAQTAVEKVYENQISVDYSGFSIRAKRSNDNIGSAIYYNTDKIELDLATGRPKLDSKGEPIKKENPSPYTISYVYLYGEKLPQDKITVGLYTNTGNQLYPYYRFSAIDLFNSETDISIYKVKHPFESLINTEKLNPDIMPESFGLTEASLQTEQKLTVSTDYSVEDRPATYGQAKVLTINGGGEGNNPKQYGYVIRIKAPYETGDIPIRLFASMRRGNGEVIGFNDEIIQAKPSATINYSKAIKLVKKDSEDNTAIDGAVFKLTSVEGEEKYLQYAKTGQDSQNNISKGTLYFTKIKAGDYILEEVITPSGYQKPSSPWKVQITVDDKGNIINVIKKSGASDDLLSIVDGSKNEITVTNKKAPITPTEKTVINYPNKIKFYKVNENGEALKGAEFKLKKINDVVKEINSIGNTSTNEFIFEKLSPGDYQLYETKAPAGYPEIGSELEVATFTVNDIGEIKKVKTYNGIQLTESDGTIHKIVNTKTKPVYPLTGGMGTVPFVGAGVSLMALAWYELRKRKYDNKGGGTN